MELTIVALEPYVQEFSRGGGFLPSAKFTAGSVGEDAPPTTATNDHNTNAGGGGPQYEVTFPSVCTPDAQIGLEGQRHKRSIVKVTFPLSDVAEVGDSTRPSRLCLVLGRDPATSNVVVKHNLAQGPLLSRRHCAIRAWFPRSSCHPSVKGPGVAVAVAFDCIDLGSVNGTFLDGKKVPTDHAAITANRSCCVVDAERLQVSGASPHGVRVCSLSFGIGSKVSEGGPLPPEQERLRFDVFASISPVVARAPFDADMFVRMLFRDRIPVFQIAAPRSSLAAASNAMLHNDSDAELQGQTNQPDGASEEPVVAWKQPPLVPMLGGSPRQSKPLLLATKSSGLLSPQKSRITMVGEDDTLHQHKSSHALRQRTDDVLSSILKDHGYSSSAMQQRSHVTMASYVTGIELQPQQLVGQHSTAGFVGGSVADGAGEHHIDLDVAATTNSRVLEAVRTKEVLASLTNNYLDEYASIPCHNEMSDTTVTVAPRPADRPTHVLSSGVAGSSLHGASPQEAAAVVAVESVPPLGQEVTEPLQEKAMLVRRGPRLSVGTSAARSDSSVNAVILVPNSLPTFTQAPPVQPVPQQVAPPTKGHHHAPQGAPHKLFSMITLSVEEVAGPSSPPPNLSQPLSQGVALDLNDPAACALGDEPSIHQQLLPKRATDLPIQPTAAPAAAGKKKKERRVTDPQETIARFCEALREGGAPQGQQGHQGHAMAQSLKASLQFMTHMNPPPPPPIPPQVEEEDDEDEIDIPLGKLLSALPSQVDPPQGELLRASTTAVATVTRGIEGRRASAEVVHDKQPSPAAPQWSQLDEFIQSQLSADYLCADGGAEGDGFAGCVLVAGGPAPPQRDARSSHVAATQRVETMKCLFTDESSSGVAEASRLHGGSDHAFATRQPSRFGTLKPPPQIPRPPPPSAAAILGATPSMVPATLEGAPPTKDDVGGVSLWSDGSCASWGGSQEELTLMGTQQTLPSSSQFQHFPTQLTMQSQMALTRHPVRRVAVEALLQLSRAPAPRPIEVAVAHAPATAPVKCEEAVEIPDGTVHHYDDLSAGDALGVDESQLHSDKPPPPSSRRVTFHPSVSQIDLSMGGPSQHSLAAPTRQSTAKPRTSAAAQRRAKLEAVLMALPTVQDDVKVEAAPVDPSTTSRAQAPQHATAWDRTMSTLAPDDEENIGAAHRMINAPRAGVGSAIAPVELRGTLKAHQWEALKFMWKCMMEEVDLSETAHQKGPQRRPRNESISGSVKSSLKKRARTESSPGSRHRSNDDDDGEATAPTRQSTNYNFDDLDGNGGAKCPPDAAVDSRPRGCVLAHAMGLGKSLTTIAFLFSLWRYLAEHPRPSRTSMPWVHHLQNCHGAHIVICVPKPLAYHWIRELHTWSTTMNEETVTIYLLSQDTKSDKLSLLREWANEGSTPHDATSNGEGDQEPQLPRAHRSVLLITHSTLCSIMMSPDDAATAANQGRKPPARRAPARKKKTPGDDDEAFWCNEAVDDDEAVATAIDAGDARRAQRLENLQACRDMLVQTANLVIVDEAHKLQSPSSRLAQSVSAFRNGQVMKLALTGTPVTSSKRDELLALIQFVMPSLWTKRDLSDRSLLVEMKRFVHGRGMETLAAELPKVVEHTVVVRMSPAQEECFRGLVHAEADHGVIPPRRMLETVSRTMLISNHLDLVADWCRRRGIEVPPATDNEAQLISKDVRWALPSLPLPSIFDSTVVEGDDESTPSAIESLQYSWKMRVLVVLLQHALSNGEKIVVFSHSVKTLFLVGKLLSVAFVAADGVDFALFDGRIPAATRDDLTEKFNDPHSDMRILLLTFQSNSIGQNFTGAQRVVLFESSWKRSVELQAICRVFRYGQQLNVFVNRLVSMNGVEEQITNQRDGKNAKSGQRRQPSATAGAEASAPWTASVGADELLRCLMPSRNPQAHQPFRDDTIVDEVLQAVVSGASTIADVYQDFSFE